MKKSLFLIPCLAAALWSCSDSSPVDNPDKPQNGEGYLSYLAVNIVSNSTGTRDDENLKDFEDGTGNENTVGSVRFYFFKDDTTPYYTDTDNKETKNYIDAYKGDLTTTDAPNVEKMLKAVLVFKTTSDIAGDPSLGPKKLVAIVNPTGLDDLYNSIAALQNKVADYLTDKTGENSFVMSNSVFLTSPDKKEHIAYDVTGTYGSEAEALTNPTEIYVERVVAKVRVGLSENLDKAQEVGENVYKIKTSEKSTNMVPSGVAAGTANEASDVPSSNDTEIFVKLLGWNVTGTASKSRLVKKIQEEWSFDWTGDTYGWNYPIYNRSFWAQNPDEFAKTDLLFNAFAVETEGQDGKYEADEEGAAAWSYDFATNNSTYVQENASWDEDGNNPVYPTKIIVAAKLVNSNGDAVELAEYQGKYYTQKGLLATLAKNTNIYVLTETDGKHYEPITDADLKFVTTSANNGNESVNDKYETKHESGVNRYNSYAQINESETDGNKLSSSSIFVIKYGDVYGTDVMTLSDVNSLLKSLGTMKVWNSGYTYYWLDIAHLGSATEGGDKGVVRNHIYDYEISSIVGFGVPVPDPGETIYPEEPNDPNETYIAAKINILSWRYVANKNAQLGW